MPAYLTRKTGLAALVGGLLIAATAMATSAPADDALSSAQTKQVQQLIEQYIQDNPEAIVRAVRNLRERQENAEQESAEKNLVRLQDQIQNDPTSPIAGNPNGDVTVVEFFDYRCGYCKTSMVAIQKMIDEDDNLRVVFKEFPILSKESAIAARAALASNNQGLYFEFHAALMNARGSLSEEQIMEIAGEVDLDIVQLKQDMENPEIQAALDANAALARELDINGTPAFIIGEQLYPGALDLEGLRAMVAKARSS